MRLAAIVLASIFFGVSAGIVLDDGDSGVKDAGLADGREETDIGVAPWEESPTPTVMPVPEWFTPEAR